MSYTSLYYHIVFRTYRSEPTIPHNKKRLIFAYILKICETNSWRLVRINACLNHVHILIELKASDNVAEVVKQIKGATSAAFKGDIHFPHFQGWNKGYGAFTVGWREVPIVKEYIINQETHHQTVCFDDELKKLMAEYGIKPTGYGEL